VFSWIEGITQSVSYELIVPYLPFIMKPLVREKADNETGNWRRNKSMKEEEEDEFIHSGYFYSTSSNQLILIGAPDYSINTVLELSATGDYE